jgi:lipoprotein-anchoring transpeptidase ErfK/SrfK
MQEGQWHDARMVATLAYPMLPVPVTPPPAYATVRLASPAAVYARPHGRRITSVRPRTAYGTRTRLWVRAVRGPWLEVSDEDAPGGAGWIRAARTTPAAPLPNRVRIDRSAKRLTLIGPTRRWSTRVIIGGAATPTPHGTFQVTDRLRGSRYANVYGAWILVLSAYGSPAHDSRVAMHGMPLGARSRYYSAGCVRIPAAALRRLARAAPPGTPVRVVE